MRRRGVKEGRARQAIGPHLFEAPRRGDARLAARGDRLLPVRPQLADRAERALVQPDEVELLAARLPHLAALLGQGGDPFVHLGGARLAARRLEGRAVARLHRRLRLDHDRAQLPHVQTLAVDPAVGEHVLGVDGVLGLKVDGGPARLQRHDRLVGGHPFGTALIGLVPSIRAGDVGVVGAERVRPLALVGHHRPGGDEHGEAGRRRLGRREQRPDGQFGPPGRQLFHGELAVAVGVALLHDLPDPGLREWGSLGSGAAEDGLQLVQGQQPVAVAVEHGEGLPELLLAGHGARGALRPLARPQSP